LYTYFCTGAGNEVYRVEIPEAFHGMLYENVALHCFMTSHLNMMLIAVEASSTGSSEQLIYPAPFGFTIDKGMFGYFIAQDEEQASALRTETSKGKFVSKRTEQTIKQLNTIPLTDFQSDTTPLTEVHVEMVPPSNSDHLEVKPTLQHSGESRTELFHKRNEPLKFDDALLKQTNVYSTLSSKTCMLLGIVYCGIYSKPSKIEFHFCNLSLSRLTSHSHFSFHSSCMNNLAINMVGEKYPSGSKSMSYYLKYLTFSGRSFLFNI